jgi:hypothetical protein
VVLSENEDIPLGLEDRFRAVGIPWPYVAEIVAEEEGYEVSHFLETGDIGACLEEREF